MTDRHALKSRRHRLVAVGYGNKRLSWRWHTARTLVHFIFPTLRPAIAAILLAGFFDSQLFTRGQLLIAYVVFCDFYLPLLYLTSLMRGSHRAIRFIFDTGKLEWLRYSLAATSSVQKTKTNWTFRNLQCSFMPKSQPPEWHGIQS